MPPLNNVDVRKAINYAINRTQILQQWGGPLAGSVTDNIIPAGQTDYKQFSLYPNTPNLTKAKKLMAQSGVKTPVTLALRTQNDTPGFINMAQVIQSNLKPIGINVKIVGSPNSVNGSFIANPKAHVPMGIEPWSLDFPDGEAIINTGLDPATPNFAPNLARWSDTAFVGPFNKAIALQSTARQLAYQNLDEQIMTQQAPFAPLFNPRWYDFVSARLGGYVYSEAMDAINYNTLYIKLSGGQHVTVSRSQVASGRRWPRFSRSAAVRVPGQRAGSADTIAPPARPGPLLEISDLAVTIPTESGTIEAVRGISLAIGRGETLGVVGESGSGKTMLALVDHRPAAADGPGHGIRPARGHRAAGQHRDAVAATSAATGSRWSSRTR